MLRCLKCEKQSGFLVLGMCHACGPHEHLHYVISLRAHAKAAAEFEAATGLTPLDDFDRFERHVAKGEVENG